MHHVFLNMYIAHVLPLAVMLYSAGQQTLCKINKTNGCMFS